jgi:3'(2'), 5'-bisphosphate nucleotidase
MALSRSRSPFLDIDRASRGEIGEMLARIALSAGPAVMNAYERGCEVFDKDDGSPVTQADRIAEAIICGQLAQDAPDVPVVAEEAIAAGNPASAGDRFLLVDPLDGTKEFLARNGEFTINIAFIEQGSPIAGAVYAPALARLWFAGDRAYVCDVPVGGGLPEKKDWRPIRTRAAPSALVVLASRSHVDPDTEAFLARLPVGERLSRGSSLKFCVIAEGRADVYPRFGRTMEWDTAAGDAVLRAAGGIVRNLSGEPLAYGKTRDRLSNGPFVAWGDATAGARFGYR